MGLLRRRIERLSQALARTSLVESTLGNNNNDNTAHNLQPAVSFRALPLDYPDPSITSSIKLHTRTRQLVQRRILHTRRYCYRNNTFIHLLFTEPDVRTTTTAEQEEKTEGGKKVKEEDGKNQGNDGKKSQPEVNIIIDGNAAECGQRERGD